MVTQRALNIGTLRQRHEFTLYGGRKLLSGPEHNIYALLTLHSLVIDKNENLPNSNVLQMEGQNFA